MYRGTTPTLKFTLPFACSEISLCSVAISQDGELILEKKLSDCSMEENILVVTLTEEDTLKLDCRKHAEIQLRIGCGGSRLASNIIRVGVGRILKDGCLE